MTVLGSRLLVADITGDELYEIDPDGSDTEGTRLRAFPSGLTFPQGMTVLGSRLLVADNTGDDLWEIDPDGSDTEGTRLRAFPSGLTAPTGMTVLPPAAAAPAFADSTGDAQSWTQNTAIASITVPAATGTPTPTYAAVGTLPAGINFNATTRVISGTRTATGSGTITIRATNSEGSADWTVAYTTAAPPATVPAQPTGFAATVTHNSVSLTWADPNDSSITSYQILRRDITGGGSLGVHIDSVPAGTSYVDTTNVEPENTYSYRIKARNAQGLSGQSGYRNVTTLAVPSVDHAVDAVAVAWTFNLPEPTVTHTPRVTTDHAVDAGAVAWVFNLPEPTVTHTPRVTTDHAVDAGDASWTFDLPEPTVTHTPRVTTDHAVDAGAVAWVFNLPEPSVTVAYAVDAAAVAWTFGLPEPTVTHTPPAATVPSTPTGLGASATHDTVSLTWDDPGDASITSYQILRRDITGGGSLGVHIDSAPAGTSYVDSTNVASSNTYSYRIKARNAQGLSAQSGYRNATTSAAPLTPINHAVDAVAVAWTFDLPEPTVAVDHAVDAAAVAWVFDLPEPTVTSALAFSVELTLTQTATENVYTWTNPDSYILDFVCADDDPIVPLSGYSSVRSSIPASLLTLRYTRPAGAPYYALRLVSTDQFSNTVGPADNVASGDYAVDAVAVAWTFYLPEPTVTVAYAVDAVAVSWAFDLPEPSVTYTPRVTVAHAVDAGAVAWVFDLPEPTVTHTVPQTTDHAVDAVAVSWVFDVPEADATLGSAAIVLASEVVEVDWDNDGNFANTYSDVTNDVLPGTLNCRRGREYGTQLVGRSTAGRFHAVLRNDHRRYDPHNVGSPLVGKLTTSPRIRWTVEDSSQGVSKTSIWGGFLQNPALSSRRTNDTLRITAYGILSRLGAKVSVAYQTDITTGAAAALVAAAAGLATSDYLLEGTYSMPRWGVDDQPAIEALHDLEETERGFIYEDHMGRLRMEARTARVTGDSRTPALTLSDQGTDLDIIGAPVSDISLRDVIAIVQVPVRLFTAVAEAVLWTAAQDIIVPAQGDITIIAVYPVANSPAGHVGVSSWTGLASGTDYTAQTGLAVTTVDLGDRFEITLENSASADITVDDLQARGQALTEGNLLVVQVQDSDSRTLYGPVIYPSRETYFANPADAQGYAEFLLSIHGEPRAYASVSYLANDNMALAAGVDISRRVTLELRDLLQDHFIEGIAHGLRPDIRHETTYTLAPVDGYAQVIVLDIGPPLGVGTLG